MGAPIRVLKLSGRDRYVAFFELFDQVLGYGGMTERELWDSLQVKYGVNRSRRLAYYLRQCRLHCVDVEALLAKNRGNEEELIAQFSARAEKKLVDHEWKVQTWKGGSNTYQQLPAVEQND